MSNTFKKTSARGFTLIELLVVIAIIGLLSTIIAAPIQNARKKARDAKKIAELKSVQLALEQYAESNQGAYPNDFASLSPIYMPLLPTFASSTTSSARDAFKYTYYKANATGAATTTFAYHLGAKLEVYGPALETDRDCIGGTSSNQLASPYCVVYNGEAMNGTVLNNGSQIVASATLGTWISAWSGQDFEGALWNVALPVPAFAEATSTSCVGGSDCIFDVTSQQ